jgi:hypothetical protein
MAEKNPPEHTRVAFMRPALPALWLTKNKQGKPIVSILACRSGTPEEREMAVAPVRSWWAMGNVFRTNHII